MGKRLPYYCIICNTVWKDWFIAKLDDNCCIATIWYRYRSAHTHLSWWFRYNWAGVEVPDRAGARGTSCDIAVEVDLSPQGGSGKVAFPSCVLWSPSRCIPSALPRSVSAHSFYRKCSNALLCFVGGNLSDFFLGVGLVWELDKVGLCSCISLQSIVLLSSYNQIKLKQKVRFLLQIYISWQSYWTKFRNCVTQ